MNKENYIIIGNGAAGFYAADRVREKSKHSDITIISTENEISYYRPSLSSYLSKDKLEDTFYLAKEDWYKKNNIKLMLGKSVELIDTESKKIFFEDGEFIFYSKLILANGSHNFIPPIPGNDKKGVFSLKSLCDAEEIKSYAKDCKKAIVIGGGLLGLEAAWELKQRGLEVTVVEFFERLLPRQLDEKGSRLFKSSAEKSDIEFILGDSLQEIMGDEKITGVKLKSGNSLDADLLLFSVGIRANKDLASKSGISTNNGIIVNNRMETNIKDIYACGDVAELNSRIYGNWPAAVKMGKTAGDNATGENQTFEDFVPTLVFTSMNTRVFSCGNCHDDFEQFSYENPEKGLYYKYFFKDDKLCGAMLLGNIALSSKITSWIKKEYSKKQVLSEKFI
ncbi:FAD-dependent oxidoreductase [Clostridium sp. MSJ-11]|uniref:FAD-dependent oxidoreductase n=1 Tax=Clostridium mobile TaxID=2841512 RepID=A0ABS6EJB0_9CLOT|nr:FAD-dependent oxidoreductase [Clostridium mobile]MBU5485143.1 FAD-dependent oxidoreductase [Clostridium mobile]